MLKAYEVLSPEYTVEEKIPGMMRGPRHETRDYLRVFARNKRRAKVVAVRVWRSHGEAPYSVKRRMDQATKWTPHPGIWWGDTNWKNPFAMLTVKEVGPVKDARSIMQDAMESALNEEES